MIQVIRRGAAIWEVTRVKSLPATRENEAVNEYETIGRIVKDRERFWVEFPVWDEAPGAHQPDWRRQSRPYLLHQGALRAITDPLPELKS